ncbi:MAG: hydrogenase maturation protease [Clostridiales bacterium]|jgi:hydrogenase maturation protease|nr:hydrogenase maturation protease [Clostridiales bacterium]
MSIKVIGMGNVLMKDDGIGMKVANVIEENLSHKNIEVIYGETDFEYCISMIKESDYLFILDAACYEKVPGEITRIPLNQFVSNKKGYSQHSYNFLDLLKLNYPNIQGEIFAIEIKEIDFCFDLSIELKEKIKDISNEIIDMIDEFVGISKSICNKQ